MAKRLAIPKAWRIEILEKTNGRCHVCATDVREATNWSADHVFPLGRGGEHSVGNLVPVCPPCNRARWMRSPETIRRILVLGTFAHIQCREGTELGKQIAAALQAHELGLASRRRSSSERPGDQP